MRPTFNFNQVIVHHWHWLILLGHYIDYRQISHLTVYELKNSGNVIIVKGTKHIKAVDNTLQLFRYRVECDTDVDNIWQSSAHMFNILPFFLAIDPKSFVM